MLGKRRPRRERSGVSGLQGRQSPQGGAPRPRLHEEGAVVIERLAHDGRGLVREATGKTLFVEGALPGERVAMAVHRTRKRFDEGHVRELLAPAAERVEPPCPHFARCGGCDLQHLAVPAQRRHKQAVLLELLARQGLEVPGEPELLAGAAEGYRRRARLGVKLDAEGALHLGFRARHSHRLVDLDRCPILVPALEALLTPLHRHLAALEAPRHVGHLELLDSDQGVVLVVRQLREHAADAQRWCDFAAEQGLYLACLAGRESPTLEWLTDAPTLSCRVPGAGGDLVLGFVPGDFLQANGEVNRRMVATALTWLEGLAGERVLDLFAGVGNFSLPLASTTARVVAAEGSPAMVERLADNARRNDLAVTVRQADLGQAAAVAELLAEQRPDTLLLDPPRGGAEAVVQALVEAPVPRVLYVSCDPATLARDAARLVHGGYRLARCAMADMFVHTSHLESMLLFEHPRTRRQRQGASPDG